MRKIALLLLVVFLASILGGCWDYQDIEKQIVILTIGIDKGETSRYKVTLQVLINIVASEGEVGRGVTYRDVVGEGNSIETALNSAMASVSKGSRLQHVKLIIIGRELAEEGIDQLHWLRKSREVPTLAFFAVAEDRAEDLIKLETESVEIVSYFLYHSSHGEYNRNLETLGVRVWKIWRDSLTDFRDWFAPKAIVDAYGGNYNGAAVSSKGKFVGWLTPAETALLQIFLQSGVNRHTSFMIELDEGWLAGRAMNAHGTYNVSLDAEGNPLVNLTMNLDFSLNETAPIGAVELSIEEIEELLEKNISNQVEELINKLQELKSDPLGLGERLRRVDPYHPALEDWHEFYPQLEVRVNTQVKIVSGNRMH